MSLFGDLKRKFKRKIGNFKNIFQGEGSFVYRALKPIMPTDGSPLFPLNNIFKNRYCGPGNALPNGNPKNITDHICMEHDWKYHDAFNHPDKQQAKHMERQADIQMLQQLRDHNQFEDVKERITHGISYAGISAKLGIEDAVRKIGEFVK